MQTLSAAISTRLIRYMSVNILKASSLDVFTFIDGLSKLCTLYGVRTSAISESSCEISCSLLEKCFVVVAFVHHGFDVFS